jgi:alpha-L-fucosidase
VLQEPVQTGQRVKSFLIQLKNKNETLKEIKGTTIGKKRIITFPAIEADSFNITFPEAKADPLISEIAVYKIHDSLIEK